MKRLFRVGVELIHKINLIYVIFSKNIYEQYCEKKVLIAFEEPVFLGSLIRVLASRTNHVWTLRILLDSSKTALIHCML